MTISKMLAAAAVVFAFALPLHAQAPDKAVQPWFDPSLPATTRANDLISRMTLEEKASQLVNQARAIPHLGVPAYNWWSEALHGVARNGYATVFPEPIGLGATFDAPLIHEMAVVIGTEARVKFNIDERVGRPHNIFQGLDFWSPNINIFRDPRWGRGQETYGEDPFLTAHMGVAFITGLQGDDPNYYRVIATPKHYAVHSGPEPSRHEADVPISKHDEEDTYLPAFRAAIVVAKAGSIMCAYNSINGQPACANDFLLNEELRGKWNFQGYTVSDCDAVADIQRGHHFTQTIAEAAAVSLKHGVDSDCADFRVIITDSSDYGRYVDAVKQGLLSEQDVDASVRRLFTARIKLGLFDPPAMVPYTKIPDSEVDSEANRELALKTARESMVLLKNNGVLPLRHNVRRIAVIGPLADQIPVLEGNYNGQPSHPVTALDGIRRQFPDALITYEPGSNFLRADVPVPATAFTMPDARPGIKAEFFAHADFSGAPILTRTEQMLLYDRNMQPALGVLGVEASRWTGFLSAPESGTYNIGLNGAGAKLWVDGKLVVEIAASATPGIKTAPVTLDAGHKYALKVEQVARGPLVTLVWTHVVADPAARAIAAAKKADIVVAVAGISSALEGEEMKVDLPGFLGGDRTDMQMPAEEEHMLELVKATGKPLVLVLMNGSALAVNWASKNADAIVDAWYPGEEGGNAIAETLSGSNNPGGRLPVTFYKSVNDIPAFTDYAMKGRTYRYFTGTPLYPFGYGLSYTKFSYSDLRLSAASIDAGQPLGVDVDVRNTGARTGETVVELYLSFPAAPGTPIRALRGFHRVHLDAGKNAHVHFDLSPRDLSSVTEAGDRVVASGVYRLSVGDGQPGTGAAVALSRFTVTGEAALPE